MPRPERHVFVCMQERPADHPRGSCAAHDCKGVYEEFMYQWQQRELWGRYKLTYSGCVGPCKNGPNVLVYPDSVLYSGVRREDVATIIETHILGGRPVPELQADAEFW